MYQTLSRAIHGLAVLMACLGGALLLAVVALTVTSIAGRALLPLDIGIGPIRGIYDLTEVAMAGAVFAFLPWCQLQRGHATVDLFKPAFPPMLNLVLNLLMDLGMFIAAALIAWRLFLGLQDKIKYGETTLIMQLPVWQGYVLSLIGAVGFALVAAFCVLRALRAFARSDPSEERS
ncbi:MAG: TRAP-type C4-dicarboxylate transport system permease small subunit [Sulfitobacter sp.]|jgi:TRAP-type C4-dicarboxylate transport system permease small subunit